jgi:hypothetical protein
MGVGAPGTLLPGTTLLLLSITRISRRADPKVDMARKSPPGAVPWVFSLKFAAYGYIDCNPSQESVALGILVTWSNTKSPQDDWLIKDGGRREISALNLGPALGRSLENGKIFSSKITFQEI